MDISPELVTALIGGLLSISTRIAKKLGVDSRVFIALSCVVLATGYIIAKRIFNLEIWTEIVHILGYASLAYMIVIKNLK